MTGWSTVPLGDVASISRRGIDPTALDPETRYIGLEHIPTGGGSAAAATLGEFDLASTKFAFTDRHVLFGKLRPNLGKVSRPSFSGVCSTDILPILPGALLDAGYLAWFLRRPEVTAWAAGRAAGANLPRLSPTELVKLLVPLPPLEEQRRIAEILDRTDVLRTKRREAIAQIGAISRSLFFEMFGNPVTNPRRWTVRSLGDVVDNQDALRVPLKSADRDLLDEIYPYFGASGIIDYVDDFLFDGYRLLVGEDGANLVTRSSPIAFMASGRFWVNNHAHVLGASGVAELRYVQEVIEATDLTPYVSGSAQPKLNQANLNRIPIPVPPIEMQQAFVARVGQATVVRAQGVEQLGRLDHLFLSLQDRAFKGEL